MRKKCWIVKYDFLTYLKMYMIINNSYQKY